MLYLASTVTMPLSIATLLIILCVGEAIALFYLLGSKKKSIPTGETASAEAAPAKAETKDNAPDEADLAVILSVLCEELNARPEELVFKNVKQVTP